jgi:hypothetical protein
MSDAEGPPPPPPPFVEPYPGFSNETNGPLIVVVTTALTGLATLFVIARIYSRMISAGKIALDDWIIIVSIVCPSHHQIPRPNFPPSPIIPDTF